MRKYLFVLVTALFLAPELRAQNDKPIVVVSTSGLIHYSSPNVKGFLKVTPGAALLPAGTLALQVKSSVLLCFNGQFKRLTGKGSYPLAKVFDADSEPGIDFDADFARFVEASVAMVTEQQQKNGWGARITSKGDGYGTGVSNPDKSRDGAGKGVSNPDKSRDGAGAGVSNPDKSRDGAGQGVSNPDKSRDGWGGRGKGIIPLLPFAKVLPGKTRFYWSRPADVTAYRLDISDAGGTVVHTVAVKDTAALIRIDSVKFQKGRKYYWTVSAVNKPEIVSDPLEFTLAGAAEMENTKAEAADSQIRAEADPVLLGLMNAVALEQNNWHTEAALAYAALSTKYPQNDMVRLLHATFWMRLLLPGKAKVLLNDK